MAIFIFLMFQLVIAAPIYLDPVAKAFSPGFPDGAKTSLTKYLLQSKLVGGERGKERGAIFEFTLYWQFIGRFIYDSPRMIIFTKLCLVAINVWFFFIRKNCFIKCLDQLAHSFD